MGRIGLAFRAFFAVLVNPVVAEQVAAALAAGSSAAARLPKPEKPEALQPAAPPPAAKPARSEALTLLSTLQREARLVDFLMEPIGEYSDEQIGAAVRDVHRDSAAVLNRVFQLAPLAEQAEGDTLEIPPGFEPFRYHLTGNVSGEPPYRGTVCHHGWRATQCELPVWTGESRGAMIVTPVEVEIRG